MLAPSPFDVRAKETAEALRKASGITGLCAKVTKDEGELYLYDLIGEGYGPGGITAKDVIAKLDSMKGVRKLSVRINSEGGSVMEAKAIENAIRRFEAREKVSYIDGMAGSASTFIALGSDRVISAANATWMIHEARGVAGGRASDLRNLAAVLDKETRTIADSYARKTNKPAEEWIAMMSAGDGQGTWMNAEEATAAGLSDEVAKPPESAKPTQRTTATVEIAPVVARSSPEVEAALARARVRSLRERISGASVGVTAGQPATTAQRNGKGTP